MKVIYALTFNDVMALQNLSRFAVDPQHWYKPEIHKWVAGDRPEYVVTVTGVRCVFTITVSDSTQFKHLSMSMEEGLVPRPLGCAIASLLGFTHGTKQIVTDGAPTIALGVAEDWMVKVIEKDNLVVIAQEFKP